MSYEIHMKTPNKKELGDVLSAIAEDIKISTNETVTIDLKVKFNASKSS